MTSGQREMSVAEAERLLAGLSAARADREITDVRFAPGVRWKPAEVRGVAFRNVEWPGAGISGRFLGRGQVHECRFERVNVDSLRCRKVDFVDCHFESVTFGEHYFGNLNDCSFMRCSFIKCRFDAVGFVRSTLRSCRFDGIRAERAKWRECLLEDVTLSGKLDGASFVSDIFRRVDMSEAELWQCSLVYTKEDDLKLPDTPEVFAIAPKLFLAAEPHLRSKLDSEGFERYHFLAGLFSRSDSRFIVDVGSFDQLPAKDREVVMSTLYTLRQSASS